MCHYCTTIIYYDINNKTIENISYVFEHTFLKKQFFFITLYLFTLIINVKFNLDLTMVENCN